MSKIMNISNILFDLDYRMNIEPDLDDNLKDVILVCEIIDNGSDEVVKTFRVKSFMKIVSEIYEWVDEKKC